MVRSVRILLIKTMPSVPLRANLSMVLSLGSIRQKSGFIEIPVLTSVRFAGAVFTCPVAFVSRRNRASIFPLTTGMCWAGAFLLLKALVSMPRGRRVLLQIDSSLDVTIAFNELGADRSWPLKTSRVPQRPENVFNRSRKVLFENII